MRSSRSSDGEQFPCQHLALYSWTQVDIINWWEIIKPITHNNDLQYSTAGCEDHQDQNNKCSQLRSAILISDLSSRLCDLLANISLIMGWTNLKIILKFNSKFFLYLLWSWVIALINLFSCFYIFEDNEEASKDSSVNVIKVTIVTSLNHHHKSQTCTILNIPRQRSPTIK